MSQKSSRPPRRGRRPGVGKEIAATVKAHRLWRREVLGSLGFVENLCSVKVLPDPEWAKRMFTYHSDRVKRALGAAPPECRVEAAMYQQRLEGCKLPE